MMIHQVNDLNNGRRSRCQKQDGHHLILAQGKYMATSQIPIEYRLQPIDLLYTVRKVAVGVLVVPAGELVVEVVVHVVRERSYLFVHHVVQLGHVS